ncbi:hypothetical protein BKA61DRAFT_672072 [Leptodontidium sp. MPI-SDFR-AT-0119]|nr:hypothetical protein BKA61DRAFT_672072 [Leptodontidium sp. MPI-SDFR-AT-0119]
MHLNPLLLASLSLLAPCFSAPTNHSPNIEISISTEASFPGSASEVSRSEDMCLRGLFPLGFDCTGFGPEWYFKRNTCCRKIANDSPSSAAVVPAPEVSRDPEICLIALLPPNYDCTKFGSGWYYNKDSRTCCTRADNIPQEASTVAVPTHEESLAEVCSPNQFPQGFRCRIEFGMPTGFESKSSVHSNVNVHGGMPTVFESKSRVESYENVHTEML